MDGSVVLHRIVPRDAMRQTVPSLCTEAAITQIVLGHATSSRSMAQELHVWLPEVPVAIVDETGSTLEARGLYWQHHPPRGWRRTLPLSLQAPPEPIDDFAAVVLARRYLERERG